jgi:hypothetical protein
VVDMTRFRTGLIVGFGIGYVLGTKAGRERYEQIKSAARTAWESQPAEKMRTEVAAHVPDAVTNAVSKIDRIRHPNGDRAMTAARMPT